MYLTSPSNLAFNPIGSSVDSETMYVISLTNQNTTRYTRSLDLTTNLVGLENNPLYPHVYYSITADGGFMMGGTTTDKVILNGTTEGNAVSRRDDRFMTAPPFYECLGSYKVATPWFAKYDNIGVQETFFISSGNGNGQYFAGFSENVINNTYNVFLKSVQNNANCNSGSGSWTLNQSTLVSGTSSVIRLNSDGEVFDIATADFQFSLVESLANWGPEMNGTQVGFWASTINWNSSVTISAGGVSEGVSFVKEGVLIAQNPEPDQGSSGGILRPAPFSQHTKTPQLKSIYSDADGFYVYAYVTGTFGGDYYYGNHNGIVKFDYDGNYSNLTTYPYGQNNATSNSYSTFHLGSNLTIRTVFETYSEGYHLQGIPQGSLLKPVLRIYAMDTDGDFLSDLNDPFPYDWTQWDDSDMDGFGDNPVGNNSDDCVSIYGISFRDLLGCPDADGDGQSNSNDVFPNINSQWLDFDSDGYGDNNSGFQGDDCPSVFGESNRNGTFGCLDNDFDGWADSQDHFPNDSSQWQDFDGDGYGDEFIGFQGDACPNTPGNSTQDRFGCTDADGDGWSDEGDAFPTEPTQHSDRDLDGYGDNQSAGAFQPDAFPGDTTQWTDADGDGHGDNPYGTLGDQFPNDPNRWKDSDNDGVADEDDAFPFDQSQANDTDGDGYGDNQNGSRPDAFPNDANEWFDTDGDGYGNNVDAFPNDGSQWNDTDEDGHGDNPNGNSADRFPNDPNRWQDSDHDGVADEDDAFPDDATQDTDSDGDGYGDNAAGNRGDTFPNDPNEWDDTDGDDVGNNVDAFPFDPSQTTDADGDGFGDNPRGTGADKFPEDATQWSDIDGDGYGDNAEGTTPDAFIADPTQWSDIDGDGYGDNPTGRLADAFPNDPTQWEDMDGDGFGDNLSGNNPDPYLFDFDNDGYNDSIDPLPKLASPGDLDNDGVLDENDAFPEDYREWADADGDGEGDNADTDDDNDGWTDTDEMRQGTDPFSSSSQPIDGFEVIIPGTQVSLGAWDLIGIFGGVPVFIWIAIGFATRNGRTARYEEMLRGAQSVEDLEHISGMWEYSLMMRMLGPHQGIRLERLRADLEYEFLGHRRTSTLVDEYDQTEHVEKSLPRLDQAVAHEPMETEQAVQSVAVSTNVPTAETAAQRSDENGYEWFTTADGTNFYRTVGSGDEWIKFEN
ncbi:MAG: hypothetical protein ACPID1_03415 [Poseidonia sp.]